MSPIKSNNPSLFQIMTVWILLWFGAGLMISFAVKMQTYDSLKLYYFICAYYVVAAGFGLYYYKVK